LLNAKAHITNPRPDPDALHFSMVFEPSHCSTVVGMLKGAEIKPFAACRNRQIVQVGPCPLASLTERNRKLDRFLQLTGVGGP